MFKRLKGWMSTIRWGRAIVTVLFGAALTITSFQGVRGIINGVSQARVVTSGGEIGPHLAMTKATEERLTQWVYDNSELISRAQCAEIVREAMKAKYPLLMLSIIELESKRFTPGALSPRVKAMGWCQINYGEHGKELIEAGIIIEKRDLWNTGMNIRAGDFILKQKFAKSGGNVPRALEGYLGGRDGAYVLRILSNYANLSVLVQS